MMVGQLCHLSALEGKNKQRLSKVSLHQVKITVFAVMKKIVSCETAKQIQNKISKHQSRQSKLEVFL